MPRIYRVVSKYQPPFLGLNTAGEQWMSCRKIDLYRSIVTVGNPSFLTWEKIRQFGFARALYDSVIEKVAIVAVNVASDMNDMRMNPIFYTYISDKKRIVSYNLGMAFAKFYSEKMLRIPNLIHVEFLKKQNAVIFVPQNGKTRPKEPDLVGQTVDGNWHIFEAKGVSGSSSQLDAKVQEAKIQVGQISSIRGSVPQTRSACATFIGATKILSHIEDPSREGETFVEINMEKFFYSYYAPFLLAEKIEGISMRRETIDGLDVEVFDIERANQKLTIGIDCEVLELLKEKKFEFSQSLRGRLSDYASRGDDMYSIGLDGFFVRYSGY